MKKTVKHSMVTVVTEEEIYFDQWGKRVARYTTTTTTNSFTKTPKIEKTFSLKDGATITTVNLDDLTGNEMTLDLVNGLGQMNENQTAQFGNQLKDAYGITTKKLPDEVIAGKRCEVTQSTMDMMGMKTISTEWRWQNIILKLFSEGMGTETLEEATEVVEGFAPPEKFLLPAGAKIKKAESRF